MGTLLSEQELVDLWERWSVRRDAAARERLICHYLPMVDFLAAPFMRHVPASYRSDLVSFGVIGLMDAVDKFEPALGFRFETYGSCRIKGSISDGIRALAWLPRGAARRASRIIEKVIPVDFQAARTPDGSRLQDALSDRTDALPFEELETAADHEEVIQALHALPDRERTVIVEYYYGRRQLKEIGRDLGVTESRVCQLHRRALRQLEQFLLEQRSA